jgi:hypothetical protein
MKAAVVHSYDKPLSIEDVQTPALSGALSAGATA